MREKKKKKKKTEQTTKEMKEVPLLGMPSFVLLHALNYLMAKEVAMFAGTGRFGKDAANLATVSPDRATVYRGPWEWVYWIRRTPSCLREWYFLEWSENAMHLMRTMRGERSDKAKEANRVQSFDLKVVVLVARFNTVSSLTLARGFWLQFAALRRDWVI